MKKLFLFALVATMFAACVTDETQDVAVELAPDTLTVSFEDADSRIQLDNGKTVWTKGDLASVFYRSNANQQWQYQGETGERTGNLKRVNAGNATETMKRVVVVYPYRENYYINTDTYNVEASLPASQSYLKDSYGVGGNIMISQSEFNQFSLKSVCGWLKIQLTGNGEKVKSIKLKGNNGEQVAGLIYINSATAEATLAAEMGGADDNENTAGGNLVFDDTILTEVVLDCGEGVELGAEPTAFYIALPPQTFAQGLTIEIEDTKAFKMTQSTDKEVVISRNAIQPMSAFEYAGDFDKSEYCLVTEFEVDEEHLIIGGYYNKLPAGEDNPLVNIDYGDGTFGKENNHTYAAAGRYTVKLYFEKPITEITGYAFMMTGLKHITIPASVETINEMVFSNSDLENITFEANNTLKQIGSRAFVNCSNLQQINIPASVEFIGEAALAGCTKLTSIRIIGSGNTPYRVYLLGEGEVLITYISNKLNFIAYTAGVVNSTRLSCFGSAVDIAFAVFYKCPYITSVDIIWIDTIADTNFADCENLEDINISSTTYIGNYVLNNCPKLQTIDAPAATFVGTDSFCNNKSLFSISLGSDELLELVKVGNNNENLQIVKIPAGVTTISNSFNTCAAIAEVYCKAATPPVLINSFDAMTETVIYVPAESVNSYKRAEGWKEFAAYIVGYDFENGVVVPGQPNTEIWYTATEKVEPYETNVFGANIVSNEWDAETGKGILKFDGEITMIGENAFGFCRDLTSIDIPESVTKIENDAFQYCYGLQNIYIPNSVTSIGRSAFLYCDLKEIVIPNNVTSIGAYALCGCSIQGITIPNGVTDIADGLFKQCSQLTNVVLGNQVTSIGDEAFRDCIELQSITIPDSVTRIKPDAFRDCSSLKDVYCKAMTPPTGYSSMFTSCDKNLVIYVPSGCESEYKVATGWSNYADSIVGYDY